jgi:hypothetical protein
MGEIFIGSIKLDSSKIVKNIEILKIQDEKPFVAPKAKIMNKKGGPDVMYCGTGVKYIKSGNYQFDIILVDYESEYQLNWGIHIKSVRKKS